MQTDVLIIGSGIAGLAFAIKLATHKPEASITLVTKADQFESNTKYAQGGIAAVMDNVYSSFESHITDTLKAGKGFSNVQTVRMVVEKAPERLQELIAWGTPFDRTADGNWDFGLEGGHSVARILHHKDQTGLALEKALLQQLKRFDNIQFETEIFATELLMHNKRCHGARFLDKQDQAISIRATITYLATGGSGQVFSKTTNPLIATGDGLAMASRAGAKIEHMGFYQFHPTALLTENNPVFLITEALRGFGAHLINHKGARFVMKQHPKGELATRDVISEAIFKELEENAQENVWLDCRHLNKQKLQTHFPNIIAQCKNQGIDVFTEPIPVTPAAHYQCGGIKVNLEGKTSLEGLYANGECASTGLHGANRLASNSLLEAVVFAHEAALSVADELNQPNPFSVFAESKKDFHLNASTPLLKINHLKTSLRHLMYRFYLNKSLELPLVSIGAEIETLFAEIKKLSLYQRPSKPLFELQNMAETAKLIIHDTLYE
ncbi:L-aspartate oxidase [uncultured Planktosalinus sp.]|uniref:L-aspartate oxidase n=1 Tax=uncultured Planktosalinus sp. TaxID=1810935 RepID=UPI0030D870A6